MSRGRRRRTLRTVLAVVVVLLVAFLVATAVLFVWPATNAPAKVDAIVVLGGSGDRVAKGLELARQGYAPNLVISNPYDQYCQGLTPPSGVKVICFGPDPSTTQGEAQHVARLAAAHHWTRLLVVPSVPQTTRARIRFARCYDGTLLFDPASPGGLEQWAYNVAYEWAALAKALVVQRGC